MKKLSSVVDSFNILLGTPATNVSLFIVWVALWGPPTYNEENAEMMQGHMSADELNKAANLSYWSLLILHFLTACFQFTLLSRKMSMTKFPALLLPLLVCWVLIIC